MTIDEAIGILKSHNEWRRDNSVPPIKPMLKPKEIGIAIDVVVNELEKDKPKCDKCGGMGHIYDPNGYRSICKCHLV